MAEACNTQSGLKWTEATREQDMVLSPHLCRLMSCMVALKASSPA